MGILKIPATASKVHGIEIADKVRWVHDTSTGEHGMQIKMVNKTGGATVKGYLIHPYSATAINNAFVLASINEPDIIGVVYEAGVADASEAWVWITGDVEIYCAAAVSLSYFIRNTATGDADTTSGYATAEAAPTTPFSTDKHFQEVGHALESTGGAGLCLTRLHWN
jgi:hypothetical protein